MIALTQTQFSRQQMRQMFKELVARVVKLSKALRTHMTAESLHELRSSILRLSLALSWAHQHRLRQQRRSWMKTRRKMALARDYDVCLHRLKNIFASRRASMTVIRSVLKWQRTKVRRELQQYLRSSEYRCQLRQLMRESDRYQPQIKRLRHQCQRHAHFIQRHSQVKPVQYHRLRKHLRLFRYSVQDRTSTNGHNLTRVVQWQEALGDYVDGMNIIHLLTKPALRRYAQGHWILHDCQKQLKQSQLRIQSLPQISICH